MKEILVSWREGGGGGGRGMERKVLFRADGENNREKRISVGLSGY